MENFKVFHKENIVKEEETLLERFRQGLPGKFARIFVVISALAAREAIAHANETASVKSDRASEKARLKEERIIKRLALMNEWLKKMEIPSGFTIGRSDMESRCICEEATLYRDGEYFAEIRIIDPPFEFNKESFRNAVYAEMRKIFSLTWGPGANEGLDKHGIERENGVFRTKNGETIVDTSIKSGIAVKILVEGEKIVFIVNSPGSKDNKEKRIAVEEGKIAQNK